MSRIRVVVDELFRVLRPGGRAVLAEPDWGTLAIDGPDAAATNAYQALVVQEVVPVTAVFHDVNEADQVLGLGRVADRAREAGYFTADAARRWTDHVTTARSFASVTLFVVALDR